MKRNVAFKTDMESHSPNTGEKQMTPCTTRSKASRLSKASPKTTKNDCYPEDMVHSSKLRNKHTVTPLKTRSKTSKLGGGDDVHSTYKSPIGPSSKLCKSNNKSPSIGAPPYYFGACSQEMPEVIWDYNSPKNKKPERKDRKMTIDDLLKNIEPTSQEASCSTQSTSSIQLLEKWMAYRNKSPAVPKGPEKGPTKNLKKRMHFLRKEMQLIHKEIIEETEKDDCSTSNVDCDKESDDHSTFKKANTFSSFDDDSRKSDGFISDEELWGENSLDDSVLIACATQEFEGCLITRDSTSNESDSNNLSQGQNESILGHGFREVILNNNRNDVSANLQQRKFEGCTIQRDSTSTESDSNYPSQGHSESILGHGFEEVIGNNNRNDVTVNLPQKKLEGCSIKQDLTSNKSDLNHLSQRYSESILGHGFQEVICDNNENGISVLFQQNSTSPEVACDAVISVSDTAIPVCDTVLPVCDTIIPVMKSQDCVNYETFVDDWEDWSDDPFSNDELSQISDTVSQPVGENLNHDFQTVPPVTSEKEDSTAVTLCGTFDDIGLEEQLVLSNSCSPSNCLTSQNIAIKDIDCDMFNDDDCLPNEDVILTWIKEADSNSQQAKEDAQQSLRCTPEEIERKKCEALKRLKEKQQTRLKTKFSKF